MGGTVPLDWCLQELWLELTTAAEMQAAQNTLPNGKMLVVDYYAGWCAVCKTAYPSMCRLADNKELQQHYLFAKASLDCPEIKDWVKQEGIRGIPHIAVYEQSGTKLLGMGASFKKADTIMSNLKVIAANKDTLLGQGELMLDPNFFVILPAAKVAA
eukprot:gene1222-1561_t